MGRHSTGIATVNQALKIDISYLRRNGFIIPGECLRGVLEWSNGASVSIESKLSDNNHYIRLKYRNTFYDGTEKDYDYKIWLTTIPSNLGRGEIYYFICPVDYSLCRILYKCYHSGIWKSRIAYQNRIYYPCQTSSNLSYYNDRYWAVESQLKEFTKQVKSHYRGRETALQRRIERLEYKKKYYDLMRWRIVPKTIQELMIELG
jgi:hypothetical protein